MKQKLKDFVSSKQKILIIAVISFGIFLRFYQLSYIPTVLSQDQLIYAANAQAVVNYWSDLSNTWNPLSLSPFDQMFAELPAVIMAPAFLLPITPILASRITFAFLGLGIAVFLAMIAKILFTSKSLSITVFIIALYNPWMIQMGRLTFDAYISMFFLLSGSWLFLHKSKLAQLASAIPFFIGFYQYQGHKLVFLPWVVILLTFSFFQISIKKERLLLQFKSNLSRIIVAFGALILMAFYLGVQLPSQSAEQRISSLLSPEQTGISFEVNTQRRLSFSPFSSIYYNKYSLYMKEIASNTLDTLNPRLLFWEGQADKSSFSVWQHGLFYFIDALLLLAGMYFLIRNKNHSQLALLVALSLAALLPSIVNTSLWVFFRPSMVFPVLIIVIGYGFDQLINRKNIGVIIALLYGLSVLNFMFILFNSYPIRSSSSTAYPERIVSSYLSRIPKDQKVIIITKEPHYAFTSYLFYNNLISNLSLKDEITNSYQTQEYSLNNVSFISPCIEPDFVFNERYTYLTSQTALICSASNENQKEFSETFYPELTSHTAIGDVIDSSETYKLFNDTLCKDTELPEFIHITKRRQFNLDSLSTKEFCSTWIIQ